VVWIRSGASAHRVCTWSCLQLVTSGVASEKVSGGLVNEGQTPDEPPRFELVVTVRLLYAVVQPAENYNSLDAKGWMLRQAVLWHFCQLVVWSVSVGEDGRSSSLLSLWDAASFIVSSLSSITPRSRTTLTGWTTPESIWNLRSSTETFCSECRVPNQISSLLLALSWSLLDKHLALGLKSFLTPLTGDRSSKFFTLSYSVSRSQSQFHA